MYARAAKPAPCPLCRNRIGSGTLACTAADIPPRRIEIPETLFDSIPINLSDFATAPEICCLDIRCRCPSTRRSLENSGGQCRHLAAGFNPLVHCAEILFPSSSIIFVILRIVHNSYVEPGSRRG